jgi:hypothetical protein
MLCITHNITCAHLWCGHAVSGGSPVARLITSSPMEVWQTAHMPPSATPCIMLHKLQPRTRYSVHVCAVLDGDMSVASQQVVVPTMPAPPQDGPRPSLEAVSHAVIAVSWPATDVGPDSDTSVTYSLQRAFVGSDSGSAPRAWTGIYKGPRHDCIVDSLLPGQIYAFRVRVHCGIGRGRWGPYVAVRTHIAPPAPPCNVNVKGHSARSLCVHWCHSETDGQQAPTAFQYAPALDRTVTSRRLFKVYAGTIVQHAVVPKSSHYACPWMRGFAKP